MDAAKLDKYEAWTRELESRQRLLTLQRPGHLRLFAGMVAVSPAGFVWNAWVGVATLLTGIMCGLFGLYVVNVRAGDYRRELQQARREMRLLRTRLAPMGDGADHRGSGGALHR
jgi:hypothetical protein